ncbi:MAG: hypothetical protein ACFBSG_14690 [Leptolyngbyaceae cyanobacterium]
MRPFGSAVAAVGFVLIILSQLSKFSFGDASAEARDDNRFFTYFSVGVFFCGLVIIGHDSFQDRTYVPKDYSKHDSIELAYEFGILESYSSSTQDMRRIWEGVLRDFSEESRASKFENFEYFQTKIFYAYAENLLELNDYNESSRLFNAAYFNCKKDPDYFDKQAAKDTLISNQDFIFDSGKAYEAFYWSGFSSILKSLSIKDENARRKGLQNALNQLNEILEDQPNNSKSFRGRVWNLMAEVQVFSGDEEEATRFYIYAFLNSKTLSNAVSQLQEREIIRQDGSWNIPAEKIDDFIAQSDKSILPPEVAMGGDEEVTVQPDETLVDLPENQNPFDGVDFPLTFCGDRKLEVSEAYPWLMVPVFLMFSEENLLQVSTSYCEDAFYSKRKDRVQVATFSDFDKAHYFHQFLASKFGEQQVETGARHVYCDIESEEPLPLINNNSVADLCG